LQDQHRPAIILPAASDCGWNHGKLKESIMEGDASELENPIPNKIPDIVWNDLLHSEIGIMTQTYILIHAIA